jgi:hypothetical protein
VYEIADQNIRLSFFHPALGAASAACLLEEVIAFGRKQFISCEGCGVLAHVRENLFWLCADSCLTL